MFLTARLSGIACSGNYTSKEIFVMTKRTININKKIKELELAVAKLKSNRNYLIKELETVKAKTRRQQTIA